MSGHGTPLCSTLFSFGRGKPLYARRWLSSRLRWEARLSRLLGKWSRILAEDTRRLTEQAVVDYHKAQGTWPDPDHIYVGMRG